MPMNEKLFEEILSGAANHAVLEGLFKEASDSFDLDELERVLEGAMERIEREKMGVLQATHYALWAVYALGFLKGRNVEIVLTQGEQHGNDEREE